jgi:hypothetical protein
MHHLAVLTYYVTRGYYYTRKYFMFVYLIHFNDNEGEVEMFDC